MANLTLTPTPEGISISMPDNGLQSDSVVTIRDAVSGSSARILPGVGFNCFDFQAVVDDQTVSVVWAEEEFGIESALALHGIPILFPFAGRLQGNSFTFEGQEFSAEGAIAANGNVIHGFVISRPWRVIAQTEGSVTGEFIASVDDPSLLAQWPSDFLIRITYMIEGASLVCDVLVENPGNRALPFGFGTHPYFRIPVVGDVATNPVITVLADEVWPHVGELPNGKREGVEGESDLRNGVAFNELTFSGVLTDVRAEEDGLAHTYVDDAATGIRIEQTFPPSLRNCVIYVPEHHEAVAIEPWSCVPNAFALESQKIETGLDIIPPGDSWATRIVITAKKLQI